MAFLKLKQGTVTSLLINVAIRLRLSGDLLALPKRRLYLLKLSQHDRSYGAVGIDERRAQLIKKWASLLPVRLTRSSRPSSPWCNENGQLYRLLQTSLAKKPIISEQRFLRSICHRTITSLPTRDALIRTNPLLMSEELWHRLE